MLDAYIAYRLKNSLITWIGAVIVTTALIHITTMQLFPWLNLGGIGLLLLIPGFFIGLINTDVRDAVAVMFLSVLGSIIAAGIMRALPALVGVILVQPDLFVLYQFGQCIPLFLPLIPTYVLGTMAGLIVNEFLISPHIKDMP